ncbi:MAG: hypothetical protein LBO76_03760, partial [Treponema sp.]|nr:hypothetical protein [Treponema sp.]
MPGITVSETRIVSFPVPPSAYLRKIRSLKAPLLALPLCLLCSCAQSGAQSWTDGSFRAYYLGLRALELGPAAPESAGGAVLQDGSAPDSQDRAYAYFETALKSSNPYVSNDAAGQLILPLLRGELETLAGRLGGGKAGGAVPRPLLAAALYSLGRYGEIVALYEDFAVPAAVPASDAAAVPASGAAAGTASGLAAELAAWDSLFPYLARLRIAAPAEGLKDLLFGAASGQGLGWAAEEIIRASPDFLSETEEVVLKGRRAVARSAFEAGLVLF